MAKKKDAIALVRPEGLQLGLFKLLPIGIDTSGAGEATFEQWEALGAWLRHVEGGVQWWLGDWMNFGEARFGEKYAQALQETDFEQRTLENLAYVAQNIQFTRRRVNCSFSVHSEIARLPTAKEQDRWLQIAAAGEDGTPWTVAQLRTQLRLAKRTKLIEEDALLPTGKFRVLYADPPWAYDNAGVITASDAYGRAARHYRTRSIEEIAGFSDTLGRTVAEVVADDAVLFLWVPSPLLAEVWPVIAAWGFAYKTSMVWNKVDHNYGHYVSVRHEMLLICTKGSCTPDAPTPMPESVVTCKRSEEHSEKPEVFRKVIERLYPLGKRLELFARKPVEGWTVFGDQVVPAAEEPVEA